MSEEARQSAAFRALEQLLEPDVRTHRQVLQAAQPLTGEEFMEVAEERALAGVCGSPLCTKPLARSAGSSTRRKLMQATYCSGACEKAVAQLAQALGTAEVARMRFRGGVGGRSGFSFEQAVAGGKQREPEAGAQGGGVATMAATVQERIREPSGQAAEQSEAVLMDAVMERIPEPADRPVSEGSAAQPKEAAEVVEHQRRAPRDSGRLRVTFADDVQGGTDEARSPSPRQPGGPLPPGRPVIVLDAEDAPQGSELGQQFGRLQVRDADCSVAGRPDPILGAAQPSQQHSPRSTLQDVVAERQPAPLDDTTERQAAALGEVVERSTPMLGEVSERHVDAASPEADALMERRGRRQSVAQRTREMVASGHFPATLNEGQKDWLDEELEAEERAEAATADGRAVSDPEESDGSEQSFFEDFRTAVDMEGSDEDEGVMPQPFAATSKFGQLFMALDNWVTRATLDYLRNEPLQRQQMDATAAQRCDVFSRSVLGCLPRVLQALHIVLPRTALEGPLHALTTTIDFAEPIAGMQAQHWEVALMVLMKALSFSRIPELQAQLESREGVGRLSAALSARGMTEEHFACLLEVLVPDDT